MTDNTHGQVPAIQRYSIGYHSDEGGVRSLSPTSIYDDAGPWVRYEDHAAELRRLHDYCQELESQVILDCMTHVQNAEEIEHVADDVSKNGAALNMSAQQPAPATQPAPQQEAQEPAFWTVCAQYEDGDKTGWIPLPWYSNETQLGVMDLVLKAVRREGYKGMASERLQELGWEIRPVYLAPQPSLQQPVAVPLPGIKPGDFFGGRPEYAMEIDQDDFYGITAAIHHAIEMLNKHKDANTDWSPLDPKRSRRLQQALMAAWILEYPKEAAAHGIKGGQHGTDQTRA